MSSVHLFLLFFVVVVVIIIVVVVLFIYIPNVDPWSPLQNSSALPSASERVAYVHPPIGCAPTLRHQVFTDYAHPFSLRPDKIAFCYIFAGDLIPACVAGWWLVSGSSQGLRLLDTVGLSVGLPSP